VSEFLKALSSFDLVLVVVSVAFAIFSSWLFARTTQRSGDFVPVLRKWTEALDSIAPEKSKARPVRSK
jgi:hypothetical protein